MDSDHNGIAIIGVSGRFPGAPHVNQFWQNLLDGAESISFFSDEDLSASGVDVGALKKGPYVAARGMVTNPEWFDASFFNISANEATVIDPQQRLFLEASWEALEDAGVDPACAGIYVGVFAGMTHNSYSDNLSPDAGLTERDHLATRVAYKLNLKGPALSIHTACSTSLVAVCQACQALLCYQCDLALAGGVSVMFPQKRAYRSEGGMLSSDGHCRPFDAQASGTIFSDGLGVVVLKRLSEALQDGDQIYAVIKGFAINNDGAAKVGFAAPSVDGQADVIALAMGQADISPDTISYVEAHGTATPLGDPIEMAGLIKAFEAGTSRKNFCAIGSLKGNMGHMDAAAGVAGLMKTALALKHKLLPPTINFMEPNPKIDFDNSPFFVNSQLAEWKSGSLPRRAGVSSFGVGGTNAHVVLEEAPPSHDSGPAREWQLLVISAKTSSALEASTKNLREHLKTYQRINFADAAFTLQARRHPFDHRRAIVCRDRLDAIAALEQNSSGRILTQNGKPRQRSVVFMFPGQGTQYLAMGSQLYRSERTFRDEVDRCAAVLVPHLGLDLRQVLFASPESMNSAEGLLVQTRIAQPALFVVEYALARLWISWGIKPHAMIGHSVGELVAACLAGVFTLEDALGFVAARAQLIQAQPKGAMLAVRLPEEELAELLSDSLSIASVNSRTLCVVSGPLDAVSDIEKQLEAKGVATRRLPASHAFHSAMMDSVLEPLADLLKRLQLKKPSIPFVSGVTGAWITEADATDPNYWADHVRDQVRFADGLGEVLKDPDVLLLEAGPGQTLCTLANQHPAKSAAHVVLSSISESEPEVATVLTALGALWLAGASVSWAAFHTDEQRQHAVLPTYPFERKRYWIDPPRRAANRQVVHARSPELGATTAVEAPEISPQDPRDAPSSSITAGPSAAHSRKDQIVVMLKEDFGGLSTVDLSEVESSTTFMEMGLDSLLIGQAIHAIDKRFGVRVTFRQLLQDTPSLDELASFLDQALPSDALATIASQEAAASTPLVPPQVRHDAFEAPDGQLQESMR